MDSLLPSQPRIQFPAEKNGRSQNGARSSPQAQISSALAPGFHVLLGSSPLFFRVRLSPALRPGMTASALRAQADSIGEAFRDTFRCVWGTIPEVARASLLTYWQARHKDALWEYEDRASLPKPLIEIVEEMDSQMPVCTDWGFDLRFPALMVQSCPARLPYEIARVLAMVSFMSTGKFPALHEKLVDKPLDRWEDRCRESASDEAFERKMAKLEKAFRGGFDEEIALILQRWAIASPLETAS
jgi:hypothetical protein